MKKKSHIRFYICLLLPVVTVALAVVIFDPFFHYHKPLNGLSYTLSEERYQNDGILKRFDYQAMLTGSSLTQNFKTSDVKRLWGYDAVKTPYANATLRESAFAMETALKNNKDLKMTIFDLNVTRINEESDNLAYEDMPTYMYDRNPFNDYDYLFNEGVITMMGRNLLKQLKHEPSTSFDEYSNWTEGKVFGKDAIIAYEPRLPKGVYKDKELTEEDLQRIKENLERNIIAHAKAYPGVEFYAFVPPRSVIFWDALDRTESIDRTIDMLEYAFKLLTEVPNIRLYAYDDMTGITTDLDNYMDSQHYSEEISSLLLEYMATDVGRITADNMDDYLDRIREIYTNYDYDSIFE